MRWAVEVITEGPSSMTHDEARGWGDKAEKTTVAGTRPEQIQINRDGKPQFSLRILPDGRLILTDYVNAHYTVDVPQNFTLNPDRTWPTK